MIAPSYHGQYQHPWRLPLGVHEGPSHPHHCTPRSLGGQRGSRYRARGVGSVHRSQGSELATWTPPGPDPRAPPPTPETTHWGPAPAWGTRGEGQHFPGDLRMICLGAAPAAHHGPRPRERRGLARSIPAGSRARGGRAGSLCPLSKPTHPHPTRGARLCVRIRSGVQPCPPGAAQPGLQLVGGPAGVAGAPQHPAGGRARRAPRVLLLPVQSEQAVKVRQTSPKPAGRLGPFPSQLLVCGGWAGPCSARSSGLRLLASEAETGGAVSAREALSACTGQPSRTATPATEEGSVQGRWGPLSVTSTEASQVVFLPVPSTPPFGGKPAVLGLPRIPGAQGGPLADRPSAQATTRHHPRGH